ncbi:MAG: oligosaccharide repeat unit polymerase [Synergistaceae bacterium]|nr:oligosaccharide repeat unit polymerase [Synergistaceae bacterium]
MDNLFILALLYLVYLGISFYIFSYNFFSPSFVFCVSMSVMLCFAYYAAANMGMLFAINMETFTIFAWAGFIFLATEFFVYANHTANHFHSSTIQNVPPKPEPLIIHPQIQWAATIFLAMSFIIAVAVVFLNTGGGSWSARMIAYKDLLVYHVGDIRYRFITAQLYKIGIIIADLCGYVLVYNLTVCNVPARKLMSYFADVILFAAFSSVYSAARRSAVELFLFLAMIYVTLNMKPGGKKKVVKLIIKSIPIVIIFASVFTVAGSLVGRYEGKKSGLQNVAEYICGGLYSFNLHIDEGASTKLFGQASFSYLYAIPQNMGLIPRDNTIMITGKFDIYGNTVTIFGRWYRDFGAIGVFVMTSLVSWFYSWMFYSKIIYSNNITKEHHLARIYYCQWMTGLRWAGGDDRIAPLMTVETVIFVIFTAVFFKMFINKNLKLF